MPVICTLYKMKLLDSHLSGIYARISSLSTDVAFGFLVNTKSIPSDCENLLPFLIVGREVSKLERKLQGICTGVRDAVVIEMYLILNICQKSLEEV